MICYMFTSPWAPVEVLLRKCLGPRLAVVAEGAFLMITRSGEVVV